MRQGGSGEMHGGNGVRGKGGQDVLVDLLNVEEHGCAEHGSKVIGGSKG